MAEVNQIPVVCRLPPAAGVSIPVVMREPEPVFAIPVTMARANPKPAAEKFYAVIIPDFESPFVQEFEAVEYLKMYMSDRPLDKGVTWVFHGTQCPVLEGPGKRFYMRDQVGLLHDLAAAVDETMLRPIAIEGSATR